MTIKELEKRSGLPRTAIRFYEQQGFITPERKANNYRDYSEEDARTLEKVKLLLFVMEPLLLCTWGYTPGKWLLGLQVRRLDGRKLAWDQGVERLFSVLWWGQGMCIPIYQEWRNWTCYEICTDGRPLPWEQENRCMAQPIRRSRWVIWVVCWAAVVALTNGSAVYSYVPPYPDAPLTPAQVVENYNFYDRRFSDVDNYASVLNADGSWKTLPAVYQNRDWVELKDKSFGEWSPVTFATAPDGTVTGLQVDFSPKGDPYEDQMDVGWVMNEVLSPLIMAADPSGEARNPLQVNERKRQAYGVCDRLLDVPFQGAGAESQAEGPGGMTVTLEVTACSGYQPQPDVGDYSLLRQEEPGAGTLSFHITLTLPET